MLGFREIKQFLHLLNETIRIVSREQQNIEDIVAERLFGK